MTSDADKQISTDQEGNRRFSIAMIALENGDFTKSARLLGETVDIMGKTHPVGMLAMKTLAGIYGEQGKHEEALQATCDLLDAQILTFGVNHAESSRTVRNILDMCKDLGKEQMANDIAMMVQVASDMERNQTTQSFKRLRTNPDDEGIEKETLRYKIQKWIAGRLAKLFKIFPFLDPERSATLWPFLTVGVFTLGYAAMFVISITGPANSASILRASCVEYTTTDQRKRLNFTSPYSVDLQIDQRVYHAPFKVIGYSWHDVGTISTSSIVDRENWLIQMPEGLRDVNNNVYYRIDAPEREIIHHMKDVMNTSNYYFEHKQKYPKKIDQISDENFQYLNPFTKKMDNPEIQSVKMDDKPPDVVADLFWNLKNGGRWPDEPALYPGGINACRVLYGSAETPKQQFFVHGCDRYGRVMTAAEGNAYLLESEDGNDVHDKTVLGTPNRPPTFWVLKVPAGVTLEAIAFLKYRFALLFGGMTLLMLFMFLATPNKRAKTSAAVFLVLLTSGFIASLVGVFLP